MRPRRRGLALVTMTVIAMLLSACTSGASVPGNGKAGSAPTSGRAPAQPNGQSVSSAVPAAESALDCDAFIGSSAPAAPLRVVLGVVALPASPGSPAPGTSLSGAGSGPLRLFAKSGLLIKPGATFELVVPSGFASRLSIGWGTPSTPSHQVLVGNCAGTGDGWMAFAGGYWIDHPACVPIIVKAGGKQQQVYVGVGTACPGQQPPPGPTQS